MDPELIKQKQLFQKRALAQPVVSVKPAASEHGKRSHDSTKKSKSKKHHSHKKKARLALEADSNLDLQSATSASGSTLFSLLFRIVDHMKKRHLNGSEWGLSLDEILEELQIFDLTSKFKERLLQALPPNPKIHAEDTGKFQYKPPLKLKPPYKSSFLKILRSNEQEGKGGILLSELSDSIASADKVIESLVSSNQAKIFDSSSRAKDKVVFYHDPSSDLKIDEEFIELWRTVPVESLDEAKIEDFLRSKEISYIPGASPKRPAAQNQGPKRRQNRRKNVIVHNVHLESSLQDYSASTAGSAPR